MNIFEGLGDKIAASYDRAIAGKNVVFTETRNETLVENDVAFQVKLATSLVKKPSGPIAGDAKTKNPFEPPFEDNLFVMEGTVKEDSDEESFVILLNKFCVTAKHFLLVTKDFKNQTSPLSPCELLATFYILKEVNTDQRHLAFFNCGSNSGASQPHKHIQFLPLGNTPEPFAKLIKKNTPAKKDDPFQLPTTYANFTVSLEDRPEDNSDDFGTYLLNKYVTLLDLLSEYLLHNDHNMKLSYLSYNFIMTEEYMHIVPRSKEKASLDDDHFLSVNSLGFAGMILTKSQDTFDKVKKQGPFHLLGQLGFEPKPIIRSHAYTNEDSLF